MKLLHRISSFALMLSCLTFASAGLAQSTQQCVVNKIQGGLVTATCPGVGTRVENIGGVADRYKVGDTITFPSQTPSQGDTRSRSTFDPRSGRERR
jgi:hypothetical protein